ncbi:hypothetical protein HMPREF0658_1143 [Hoylesella marshii DSM 16973 = JCM 13450]|uniref:Uncharacterized protein n=1 Tax=Hoylesella marshii DSM 16973 = JCM 13450 TaxID=862515 RepID=E0NSJ2_9BACT|nr:hypothetical protein HMPREF0658_1143 [Hoylesella marshii DSM 16973 = JCM 13450]
MAKRQLLSEVLFLATFSKAFCISFLIPFQKCRIQKNHFLFVCFM